MKKTTALIAMIFSLTVISCRLNAPIKEMVNAKRAISRAYEVKADHYDKENLEKAEKELYKSHEFVKNKDVDKAKKAAIESYNFASAAILNSLPKLADDTIAEAMKLYQEAEKLYAEKFAAEEFNRADTLINSADSLKAEKKYWESYLKAKDAALAAAEAKDKAAGHEDSIREDIASKKEVVKKLEAQKLSDTAREDLKTADENLQKAEKGLSERNFKSAVTAIGEAESLIKRTELVLKKVTVKEKIAALRKETEKVKTDRGLELAGEDIEVVESTLNEAETLLEQEKVAEALLKISDAENSLKIAKGKKLKGVADTRIATLEKLLSTARKQDTNSTNKGKIDSADTLIQEGKTLAESGSYEESFQKLGDAESILNALGVANEKDRLKDREIPDEINRGKGKKLRVYVVKYRKKNTDCLWRIASRIYKDARKWPLIYIANKNIIKDPDLIFPGQQFSIPFLTKKKPRKKKIVKKKK